MYPENLKYARTHEWVRLEGDVAVIGITDFAANELADLVFIELPSEGDRLSQGSRFGEIESVKAVSDLNSPVSGEIVEVNGKLSEQIDLISNDPYGEGWMIRVRIENREELNTLMSAEEYEQFVKEEG